MKHKGLWIWTLSSCILLSGCWSSTPIEDLNLEAAVALDTPKETEIEKEYSQKGGGYPKQNRITTTFQFIIPEGSSGSKKDGTQIKTFLNMSETGDSIYEAVRELSLRTDRPPIGHHLKIIVIGEELARSIDISELTDFFTRDNDIRLSVLVMVSSGRASDVLSQALPNQIPAFVIRGIYTNKDRNSRIWEPLSLAKLLAPMHSKTSFLMQNVIIAGKEPKFAGAGVMKGKTGKLIGFLNEAELEGMIWLTGKRNGGVLKTYDPENKNLITYEILSINSKIKAKVQGEKISFDVNIKSQGRYAERTASGTGGERLDPGITHKDEELLEKHVKELIHTTLQKMQTEYHVDVADFGKALRIQHPKVWNKVKANWDETFSSIPVTYNVKVQIKEYGASGTATEY